MLATIGEAPINSLTQPGLVDAITAQSILSQVSRAVQTRGWYFNTETEYPLAVGTDTTITVPTNTLRCSVAKSLEASWDVVWRGTQLYDRQNHTNLFPTAPKPFKVDITFLFTFEQLPESARTYIYIRAARVFCDRVVGTSDAHGFNLQDEQAALGVLKEDDAEDGDYNILTGNYSVYRSLNRNGYAAGTVIVQ